MLLHSKKFIFILGCIVIIFATSMGQSTTLVSIGTDGKLTYKADAVGSVLPDYSGVGYKNSEEAIPVVPIVKTVTAVAGDNTSNIQMAINQVAAMPLQANGFRGAILFKAGLYNIDSTVTIAASGIVLRGEGTTTEFKATANVQYDLLRISGGSVSINTSTLKKITDSFVPVGTKSVTVESGHRFVSGDWVYLRRTPNNEWISMLSMDKLASSAHPDVVNWVASNYEIDYERQILAVDGNKLYFDAPVMDIIDPQYANGYVMKISSSRISNVGIENMKLSSAYTTTWTSGTANVAHDENHGWNAIRIYSARHCWVKKVSAYYFGFSCVNIGSTASFITVDSCNQYDPISKIEGGRRYSFNVDGQRCLVKNCTTRNGRHDYVTGSQTSGPNVFYKCTASSQKSDIGPHHRWATGILFDNIVGNGEMNVQDRQISGTGHGWAGSQIMLWNSKVNQIIIQSPPSYHQNWAIGCTATKITNVGAWVTRSAAIVESTNKSITTIPSLFVAQLNERLKNLGITPIPPVIEFGESIVPNGDFELWTDTINAMPDNWTRVGGYWGANYQYTSDLVQRNVLHLLDTISTSVSARRFNPSAYINVSSAGVFRVTFKVKGNVGLRAVVLMLGTGTPNTSVASATNHVTPITEYPSGTIVSDWQTLQYDISVPANATFSTDYKLHISWSSSSTSKPVCDFYIDDITVQKSIPTGIATLDTSEIAERLVFVRNGKIAFATNENIPFSIFNINGNKVAQGVANDLKAITLALGVYIVKIKNQTQKIVL